MSREDINKNCLESKLLNEQEIDKLFIYGDRYLNQGDYTQAVIIFEQLYQTIATNHKNYFLIQRNLVKAYAKNQQTQQAISLCESMINGKNEATQIWSQRFLATLIPNREEANTSELETNDVIDSNSIISDHTIKLKTLSAFKQYCQDNLLDSLREFEIKRKQTLKTITISGLIAIFGIWVIFKICLVIMYALGESTTTQISLSNTISLCLLSITCSFSTWVIFCRGCIQVYALGFKREIIQNIINFIDDNKQLTYASQLLLEDKRQTILAFTHSQLFNPDLEEPDFLEQEDCVYGKIGKTDIFFAEILVQQAISGGHIGINLRQLNWNINTKNSVIKSLLELVALIINSLVTLVAAAISILNNLGQLEDHKSELESSTETEKSTIFRGLFFEAKFAKNFNYRTFVIPHDYQTKIPLINRWRGQQIKLEDPDFNHLFRVYGDDQVESRYILSTNLMNRLVDFSRKSTRKVYISLIEGYIYIAIRYSHNLFEPKLFQSMLSFTPLREYFEDLQLMIGIVEELNLNCQIWNQ